MCGAFGLYGLRIKTPLRLTVLLGSPNASTSPSRNSIINSFLCKSTSNSVASSLKNRLFNFCEVRIREVVFVEDGSELWE